MMRKKTFFAALLVMTLPVLLSEELMAENLSSSCIVDQYTKSRLFVGGYDKENKILHLGWQVTLKDGWKTYWRSPGDAGLPPRWTWKNTRNISRIAVTWPVPERVHIFDMDTYIYHDQVILPIDVTVADEKQAATLALELEYMICAEICIPQEARYSLEISSFENLEISLFQKAQLDRYRDLVPARVSGQDTVVTPDPDQENILRIDLPENSAPVKDIIVEGPDGVLFGRGLRIQAKGKHRFKVHHSGQKSLEGQELTLTLLHADGGAREMKVTVQK